MRTIGRWRILEAIAACLSVMTCAAQDISVSNQLNVLLSRQGVVKIGLGTFSGTLEVAGKNRLILEAGDRQLAAPMISTSVSIHGSSDGSLVAVAAGEKWQAPVIRVRADEGLVFRNRLYWGTLRFLAVREGVQVVNEIFLEDYLACVLEAEIGEAPLEALKAQAVVARSEVVHKLATGRHTKEGFDLCAGEHCMAYKGAEGVTPAMRKACYETRGIVLTAGGKILDAVFHNMCGGITACAEDVWDSPHIAGLDSVWDGLRAHAAPMFRSEEEVSDFLASPPQGIFCCPEENTLPSYARKYFRWTRRLDNAELIRRCGAPLRDIRILERRPSGRVRKLALVTAAGTRVIEKELPIRRLFDLPSGFFILRVERDGAVIRSVEFRGAGSGHGVGLCQMGAWSMASKGFGFQAILEHYYPNARLSQIYR